MNKADAKFDRGKKQQIDSDARTATSPFFYWKNANRPIFIPKRKKHK